MAPKEQLSAIKEMRESGEELFAIYHSHPTAPATPSASDIEQSAYPEAYYLIISLNTKGVLEMRCFKLLHDENIVEIILTMEEG
jgi:proteasome lid subunit RPN8/RPN11